MSNEQIPREPDRLAISPLDGGAPPDTAHKTNDVPDWVRPFEVLCALALAVGTLLAINGDLDKPASGATRSSKLQFEERQRLIDQAIEAERAESSESDDHPAAD